MSKIKLVFFDMDGVIFEAASVWAMLNKSFGPEGHEWDKKGKEMWANGDFKTYIHWAEHDLNFYKQNGLTMKTFYDFVHKIPYTKGAEETFTKIREMGLKTVVISGGFKNQANRAIRDLKINHVFAACEVFFDEDEKISHWNIMPCDFEGKVDFMRLMIREYKVKPEDCAFIGDGYNDKFLAKEVGVSIAFNAHKDLQAVCTHSINQPDGKKDLRKILPFLI